MSLAFILGVGFLGFADAAQNIRVQAGDADCVICCACPACRRCAPVKAPAPAVPMPTRSSEHKPVWFEVGVAWSGDNPPLPDSESTPSIPPRAPPSV